MDDFAQGRPPPASSDPHLPEPDEDEHELVDEDDIIGGPVHVMYERLAQDDYPGAWLVAEAILERDRENRDAVQCRDMCLVTLRKTYLARIGSAERVPQLSVEPDHLAERVVDSRAEHVLHLVDGLKPVSAIMQASELPAIETLRIVSELYLRLLIEFEDE